MAGSPMKFEEMPTKCRQVKNVSIYKSCLFTFSRGDFGYLFATKYTFADRFYWNFLETKSKLKVRSNKTVNTKMVIGLVPWNNVRLEPDKLT